jgi:hypothetical protein
MLKMRWLTIFTIFVMLVPTQAALAGRNKGPLIPTVTASPWTVTTPVNSLVTYKVTIDKIPNGGMHCVKVDLFVPAGYKLYPSPGYSFYHFYAPATLDFKVKAPNTAQRKFFSARVSWSRDYACRSIRTTSFSNQVEIIVTK